MQSTKLAASAEKLASLSKVLSEQRSLLDRKAGALGQIQHDADDAAAKLARCKDDRETAVKAQALLNKLSQSMREKAIQTLEGIVSSALSEVFKDKDVKLKAVVSQDSVRPSLELKVKEGEHLYSILDSRGLGMADVISVALQVCMKTMYRPRIQLPLVLDERLKFLHDQAGGGKSTGYVRNAYSFLGKVCSQLSEQIIIVTGESSFLHNQDLRNTADLVLSISQKEGRSEIEVMDDKVDRAR